MSTLYMKIHALEEQTNSLLVSFASDKTKSKNPSDYPQFAYQPINMWPDVSDPDEIKKRVAIAGMYHAEQQEREEQFSADPTKIAQYQSMAGSTLEYSIADLTAPPADPIIEV